MKCPNCQKLNRIGSINCFYCGTPLPLAQPSWLEEVNKKENNTIYVRPDQYGEVSEATDSREKLAQEMVYIRESTVQGKRVQEKNRRLTKQFIQSNVKRSSKMEEIVEHGMQEEQDWDPNRVREIFDAMNGEFMGISESVEMQRQKLENRPAPPTGKLPAIEPQNAELWAEAHRRKAHNTRLKRKFNMLLLIPIAMVLLSIGISTVSILRFQKAGQESEKLANQATVIPSILNDAAAHTIKIPGEEGTQIYIKELHKNFMVVGGYATVEVADYTWYENFGDYVNDTITVSLSPYIRKTNGKHIPLEPVSYTIDIPLSPLEIITPATRRDTVYTSIYKIDIKVRKNSKLWINDEEYSDIVNTDDGNVTFNAPIRPVGDNVFTIRCKAQYSRENVQQVVIYREKQEIPVDLAADISSVSTFDYMTVRAVTIPEAYILVQTPHTDLDITNIDKDGSFSFKAVFDKMGDNEIVFTASKPGSKTTEIKHTVYYVPDIDKYSRSAWAMDDANYNQLINTINERVRAGQKYVCIGQIEEIITSNPQLAIMNCGTEERPLRILLENKSKTPWEIGQSYRVYADAYGMYRDLPRLTGRYTYY
ncbi:MAG: hypothetical protein SPL05_05435 [Eubacteriales bacterium]|nr:hypothetical protein [Eubacteriales bacterium]